MNTFGYVGGNPIAQIDPLGLRALTEWEKGLLSAFFGDCVDLDNIDLHGMPYGTGFSPDGKNIYINNNYFNGGDSSKEVDYSNYAGLAILAHEVGHNWQREQNNESVLLEGTWLAIAKPGNSKYDHQNSSDPVEMLGIFLNGTVEQQGKIIAEFVYQSLSNAKNNVDKFDGISNLLKSCNCKK